MIMRESHYNPRIVHRHCYGLLQIKPATARSMGYKGPAQGLLDPETNLRWRSFRAAISQTQEVAWGIADGIVARA
jgi:Transglycosylase SLT domain